MIRFEHTYYFLGALIIPVLIILFWSYRIWIKKNLKKFGDMHLVLQLIRNRPKFKHQLKFILLSLAIAFFVLALANLQFGSKKEKVDREGIDIVIALDVSRSMLAEDITPNRLEYAKQFIYNLLGKLKNDRIGLVVFAGNAYVQMPLTVDFSGAKLFLSGINTEMIPTQGTAIGKAIELSDKLFVEGENKYKTLIIISDGENHEDNAVEAVGEIIKNGVTVYTIGIGSDAGAPVPVIRNGQQVDFMKDEQNNIILSKSDDALMKEIAAKGNGKYFKMTGSTDFIDELLKALGFAEKKKLDAFVYTEYDSKYQYFLALGLLFLIIEFLLFETKSKWIFNFSTLRFERNDD
jgi:Ca-activated chloride channel family protein